MINNRVQTNQNHNLQPVQPSGTGSPLVRMASPSWTSDDGFQLIIPLRQVAMFMERTKSEIAIAARKAVAQYLGCKNNPEPLIEAIFAFEGATTVGYVEATGSIDDGKRYASAIFNYVVEVGQTGRWPTFTWANGAIGRRIMFHLKQNGSVWTGVWVSAKDKKDGGFIPAHWETVYRGIHPDPIRTRLLRVGNHWEYVSDERISQLANQQDVVQAWKVPFTSYATNQVAKEMGAVIRPEKVGKENVTVFTPFFLSESEANAFASIGKESRLAGVFRAWAGLPVVFENGSRQEFLNGFKMALLAEIGFPWEIQGVPTTSAVEKSE